MASSSSPSSDGYGSSQMFSTNNQPDIDMRSDTVTRPTPAMYDAMVSAPVGDDIFGEDPTCIELEHKVANLFGKESALFVASGTMGNLLCVMSHCWGRGHELIVGDKAHIFKYEQGGASHIAGVLLKTLPNLPDGTMDIELMKSKILSDDDPHKAKTQLICLENTHNMCGGVILPQQYVEDVGKLARDHGIGLHLDGARALNAVVASGIDPKVFAQPFDTLNLCFSKSLGTPVGSVICGSSLLISRARRLRKMLGGGMRQVGILASCGLVALNDYQQVLRHDHDKALKFASLIKDIPGVSLEMSTVQTNMVFFDVLLPIESPASNFEEFMRIRRSEGDVAIGIIPLSNTQVRCVFHRDVSIDKIDLIVNKMKLYFAQFS